MEIGSWIPQVFYDLIGRLVPGAFLIALSGVLLVDSSSARSVAMFLFKEPGIPLSVLLITGALMAYMVGTFLGAIGFAFWNREWTRKRAVAAIRLELPAGDDPHAGRSFVYDSILIHEPSAGSRLVKLQAERHMCRVLMIGTIMLFIGYTCRNWFPWGWVHARVFVGLALLWWSAYLFDVHLEVRSGRLRLNLWHLLGKPTGRK